jgi:hypothetical protein
MEIFEALIWFLKCFVSLLLCKNKGKICSRLSEITDHFLNPFNNQKALSERRQ